MNDRLESWKEIATYLQRDIRTVQRWEQTRGLPVQRIPGGKRDLITAQKSEIDKWWLESAGRLENEESVPGITVVSRRRRLTWIAAALVFAAAGTAIWRLAPREPIQESVLKPVPLTSYPGRELEPSFSPDGSHVAFSWNGQAEDNFDIYIKVIGAEKPLRLTSHPGVDINPAWSQDGRSIAFLREATGGKAEVLLVPALGGPEREVLDVDTLGRSRWPLVAWAPDGRNLAVVHRVSATEPYGLFSVSASGGAPVRITSPPAGGRGDSGVAVSPDGHTLAFSRMLEGPGRSDLQLLPVTDDLRANGAVRPLTAWNRITVGAAWTPDGKALIVSSTSTHASELWRVPVSAPQKARPIESLGEDVYQPAISQPRRGAPALVFVRKFSDSNVWKLSLKEGTRAPLLVSTRNDDDAQFSPDGSKIAFLSDRTGLPEIYLSNPDGSGVAQLGSMGGLAPGSLRWSPDGKHLVFDCSSPGRRDICAVEVAGGTPYRVTDGRSYDSSPSFSRDGQRIYFGSNRGGAPQVWRMESKGGAAVQVTRQGGWASIESPDGHMLYYVKDSGIHPALWSVPVAGGQERQVLDSVRARAFAITERGIYFIPRLDRDGRSILRFFDFSTGMSTAVARMDKATGMGLSLSPDGRTLLYTQVDREGSDLMLAPDFR